MGTEELKAITALQQERYCCSMAAAAKESDVSLEWCFTSTLIIVAMYRHDGVSSEVLPFYNETCHPALHQLYMPSETLLL